MTLNQQPELKEAILRQSQKEKDKLLVRLINKDKRLMEQLHYLLLEDENDLYSRIRQVKEKLEIVFSRAIKGIANQRAANRYKELTAYLKSASGIVNEHAAITKNKESELDLRLMIVEWSFQTYPHLYEKALRSAYNEAHFVYQATRIKTIITLYSKLHEDLQFEYNDRLSTVMDFAGKTILRSYMQAAGITASF